MVNPQLLVFFLVLFQAFANRATYSESNATVLNTLSQIQPTETPIPMFFQTVRNIGKITGLKYFFNGGEENTGKKLEYTVRARSPSVAEIKSKLPWIFLGLCPRRGIEDWNCYECKKFSPASEFVKHLTEEKYGCYGAVALDHEHRTIVVSFRWWSSLRTTVLILLWLTDVLPEENTPLISPSLTDALTNTYASQESMFQQMLSAVSTLLAKYPDYRMFLGGTSLGAGLAQAAFFLLKSQNYFPHTHYELYVVGSPRVGNRAFADFMNQQKDATMIRLNMNYDVAPLFPPAAFRFVHFNNELFLTNSSSSEEYMECSEDLYEAAECARRGSVLYWLPTLNLDHVGNYLGRPSAECFGSERMLLEIFLDLVFGLSSKVPREVQDQLPSNQALSQVLQLIPRVNDFYNSGIHQIYQHYLKEFEFKYKGKI